MGSVYRPNSRCRFYYLKYKGVDGRIYVESSRCERKEDAKKMLRAKEAKIDEGVPITPAVGKFTFDDAVADVVAHYKKKNRRSLDELERRIRLIYGPSSAPRVG